MPPPLLVLMRIHAEGECDSKCHFKALLWELNEMTKRTIPLRHGES